MATPPTPPATSRSELAARRSLAELFTAPIDQLRDVSGWSGASTFAARIGGLGWAVKAPASSRSVDIESIRQEHWSTCWAARCGLGPAPVYFSHETGVMVVTWVEGIRATNIDVGDENFIQQLAELMVRMHQAPLAPSARGFCPYDRVAARLHQAQNAIRIGSAEAEAIGRCLKLAQPKSEALPSRPIFCHHDVNAANLISSRGRLWLIDWEEAGAGNPVWDLAYAAVALRLSDRASESLRCHYVAGAGKPEVAEVFSSTNYHRHRRLAAADFFLWATETRQAAPHVASYASTMRG